MTIPGLNSADFTAMFPDDFPGVSPALITTFINLINNGYGFTKDNVTDETILNVYYWLCAHFVSTASTPSSSDPAGPGGRYMSTGQHAGLVSESFATVQKLSLDQLFMNSTRYGQVFWMMSKQLYVQNFYLNLSNGGCW